MQSKPSMESTAKQATVTETTDTATKTHSKDTKTGIASVATT